MSTCQVPEAVACELWLTQFTAEFERGLTYFDFLTAYESAAGLCVVACVVDPLSTSRALYVTVLSTSLELSSLTGRYPGATWHEREAAEMFGLQFIGLDDARPLLRREPSGRPPLLKSSVLAARAVTAWPGAAEPDPLDGRRLDNPSRRRLRPIGSPSPDWGNTDG